jgi:hemoglobin/transferrin/lactoferrin receptor protein
LKALGGTGLINDPLRFQTVNIDHARISGFEVKGMRDLGFYEGGRLKMPFAYGQAKGHNTGNQLPLNSIDPSHFMLGLNYSKNDWDFKVDVHHFAAKRAQDIDSASLLKNGVAQFSVPSSNTLNASAQWQLQKQTRLTAAVYNLTQEKYWKWSDVQGVAASSTVLDAFTQPGRLMRFTLTSTF